MLREVSMAGDLEEKVSKLNGFVDQLKEELKKIDAFKRELPLCVLLLNDAIAVLKEEGRKWVAAYKQPAVEGFPPIKKRSVGDEGGSSGQKEKNFDEKKYWLSSTGLWDINEIRCDSKTCGQTQNMTIDSKTNMGFLANPYVNEVMNMACKSRVESGGFMSFKTQPGLTRNEESQREALSNPGSSLLANGLNRGNNSLVPSSVPLPRMNLPIGTQANLQQQTARKQRRSWSPELHRRFVYALEQLGGCKAATPKQIKEVMQVDGLTNDEVKSHLQKYRLHVERAPPAAPSLASQPGLALGGLFPPDRGDSDSGCPQGPFI